GGRDARRGAAAGARRRGARPGGHPPRGEDLRGDRGSCDRAPPGSLGSRGAGRTRPWLGGVAVPLGSRGPRLRERRGPPPPRAGCADPRLVISPPPLLEVAG